MHKASFMPSFGLHKDMESLFCVVHYCKVNLSKVTEQIWNSKWVYTGSAIYTVWLWYLCSSAISNGFIIPWLFGEFRLFRKMCSPLNQRKSLIHICCSKWLCILWHYRFSCCHPCSSSSTVCSIFCQEQTLVAQTAEDEVLHLSLFLPEAASPCEAWCGGKDSRERAEERLGAARHAQGGIADVPHCHSCRGPQPASQPEGGLKNRYILENHRLSMDDSLMDMQWRMPSKSLQIIGSLRFMPSLKQKTGGSMGHFCFLLTSDFRVEEEKLADKILCLFGEK